jgi:tetratricopeptide (TPR) repeat protein
MSKIQVVDRSAEVRVGSGMALRRTGQVSKVTTLAAVLLTAGLAACGGKDKKAATTPTKGGDTTQSMKDGEPNGTPGLDGTGAGTTGGTGGGSAGGVTLPGGTSNPGGDGGGTAAEPAPVVIVPPNLDPDPAQAKVAVDDHLKIARRALAQNTPDPDTALREARLALAIDAANVDAAAMVALAYYHKRLYDTAELVLDDVYKRAAAKKNANVLYAFGLVYDKTNRAANAQLAFKQAVELDRNHTSAMINLGVYSLRNKQYDDAAELFERLVQQFGRTDAVTMTSLGSAYRGKAANFPPGGEHDSLLQRSEDSLKRAITANSNYAPAYYNIALLYLDADPFPTSGGPMDTLKRLQSAKTYFDSYKALPGAEIKLYDERMKDVSKAVKREEKRRKSAARATP